MTSRGSYVREARHWVIKLGSAVFLRDQRTVDRTTFAGLVEDIDALLSQGIRVTLVSSGAVALGRQSLGLGPDATLNIPRLQAFAALGQSRLMQMYETEFAHYGRKVAQILFTRSDLDDRQRFLNARMALDMVHEFGALAIINENDSVATDELRFGDNDQLAAMTCGLVKSDLLVILSDIDGVFDVVVDEGTGARRLTERISEMCADSEELDRIAGPSISGVGRGGMITKTTAARIAARVGAPTVIAPGKRRGILRKIADGEDVGTLIYPPQKGSLAGRKVWLGSGARSVGRLHCDAGAVHALQASGASLLAKGIHRVEGDFPEGSVVELFSPAGEAFARGVTVYNASDMRRIAGRHSHEIETILGYKIIDEIIHRDNLVLL